MYVSLCGPHSFETSTFAPEATEVVAPAAVISPFLTRYWYFSHQVGSFELLVWANAAGMASAIARVRQSLRMGERSFRAPLWQRRCRSDQKIKLLMAQRLRISRCAMGGRTVRTAPASDPPLDH